MFLRFPAEAWIIMAVEFTERFAYYGVTFMIMTYCTTMLRWSPSAGNAVVNGLYALTPAAACVSSGLADGRWGRPFSLIIFIATYAMGICLISLSSYPFMYHDFPLEARPGSVYIFGAGMLLFALGYGGMKVCTNPIMADSVTAAYRHNEQLRLTVLSNLFRCIYCVTNSGSLLGIILPPFLRNTEKRRVKIGSSEYTTGYYVGFTVSASSCVLGLLFFLTMYRRFKRNEPAPSFVLWRILARAIRIRWCFAIGRIRDNTFLYAHRWDLIDFAGYHSAPTNAENTPLGTPDLSKTLWPRKGSEGTIHTAEATFSPNLPSDLHNTENKMNDSNNQTYTDNNANIPEPTVSIDSSHSNTDDITAPQWIADTKAAIAVCRSFVAMPIYWLITNQFSTNMVLQAAAMNLPASVPPEVFNNVNTLTLLVSLVLFDRVVFPLMFGYRKPPTRGRVVSGFALMVISMAWCGAVQRFVDQRGTYDSSGHYTANEGNTLLPAGWLVPPYMMQGIASALVDTTVMEVAYVSAPPSMKGTVMALYLMASSVSGFLGLALSPVMIPENAMIIFFTLGAVLTVVTLLYFFLNPHAAVAGIEGSADGNVETTMDSPSKQWENEYLFEGKAASVRSNVLYDGTQNVEEREISRSGHR